ncbi:GTP-binding protein RHO4 [Histomonas meleagridis]|uniref:GTP-binding protein RHO4 n=1 Tax=Histomonas meleagridis TaxID=135588 RepID=UPI003559CB06|nr:GTP-binding protein RHO4 [Histomonas meleagridis]KAH0805125.1 GTP-binding protein RHO4 [Histomonas meleagridis]
MNNKIEHCNLLVIGKKGIGKTSILNLAGNIKQTIPYSNVETIVDGYGSIWQHSINNNRLCVGFWDTYDPRLCSRPITELQYWAKSLVMICYAANDINSLNSTIDRFVPYIKLACPQSPCVLAGLRSDEKLPNQIPPNHLDIEAAMQKSEAISARSFSIVTTQMQEIRDFIIESYFESIKRKKK